MNHMKIDGVLLSKRLKSSDRWNSENKTNPFSGSIPRLHMLLLLMYAKTHNQEKTKNTLAYDLYIGP